LSEFPTVIERHRLHGNRVALRVRHNARY